MECERSESELTFSPSFRNDHGLAILTQLFETGFQRGDYHDIILVRPSKLFLDGDQS